MPKSKVLQLANQSEGSSNSYFHIFIRNKYVFFSETWYFWNCATFSKFQFSERASFVFPCFWIGKTFLIPEGPSPFGFFLDFWKVFIHKRALAFVFWFLMGNEAETFFGFLMFLVRIKAKSPFNLKLTRKILDPFWLRTLRQNFARVVSLIAFQHVSKEAGAALTHCWYQWDKRGPQTKTGKRKICTECFFLIFWSHFLDFGDIMSIFREKAPNAMQYRLKILFKSFLYHTISWCV